MKKNIFIREIKEVSNYRPKSGGGKDSKLPDRERVNHGRSIQYKLNSIWEQNKQRENNRMAVSHTTSKGTYLEFKSSPDYNLTTKSLENRQSGIRLLNVRTEKDSNNETVTKATVFIPKGKEKNFTKKVKEYTEGIIKSNSSNVAHTNLMASIDDIKLAMPESFWIGEKEWMPKDEEVWCEVWLSDDSENVEADFRKMATLLDIDVRMEKIVFPERCVLCCKLDRIKLDKIIENNDYIAEIRRAVDTPNFFVELYNGEQSEWVDDLLSRLEIDQNSEVVISVLDTGVNNGHALISQLLKEEDCYAYKEEWGKYDHAGHGTKMSGICLYNDLKDLLESNETVSLNHMLESYKILPSNGENEPELYGAITTQSVSNLEIEKPHRKRVFCMAVTSSKYDTKDGSPSSWSASIDEITSGYIDNKKKLFIISGGNIDDENNYKDYPISNITSSIQSPAQSWNAITVGAYTSLSTGSSLAENGELSPYSTTSNLWDHKWPIKPEILFEGGNLCSYGDEWSGSDDLSLLTTSHRLQFEQFSTIWGTSSATAQASYMAARLQSVYPDAWPETIRALMIHSSDWTEKMKNQFIEANNKTAYKKLLRSCGYGVPNLKKAIECLNNNVNMIIESELQPFEKVGSSTKFKDMNIHEIPWPKEFLLNLGNIEINMKVTLSYFIEPGPGEVGWKDKYRYPSCGLRFDVNGSNDKNSFKKKISKSIEMDGEATVIASSVNWLLGPNNRNVGSIHSDTWKGTAAELATSNMIAVYPVGGWWKDRSYLNKWWKKIRYSLVLSISTPESTVDLYTPILTTIENATNINIQI